MEDFTTAHAPPGWLLAPADLADASGALVRAGAPQLAERLQSEGISVGDFDLIPDALAFRCIEAVLDGDRSDVGVIEGLKRRQQVRNGALELAMLASETLAEALARACRYEAFWATSVDLHLDGSTVRCRTESPGGRGRNVAVAALFALIVGMIEQALEDRAPLVEVQLRWEPRPGEASIVSQLGTSVVLGAPDDQILLEPSALNRPLPHAYRPFAEFFQDNVERIIQDLPDASSVVALVLRSLSERLVAGSGDDVLSAVARDLGLSQRSLQRKLADEGRSFSGLRDQVRLDLAKGMLQNSSRTVGEVAYALGFSSPAAFVRAFRRWTGTTPGEFRG